MIISNFNFVRIAISPQKADAVLLIDANRMLAFATSLERLKRVSRRRLKIANIPRIVEHNELATRDAFERDKASDALPIPEALGIAVAEASDHVTISI